MLERISVTEEHFKWEWVVSGYARGEKCHGRKSDKVQIKIHLAANTDGSMELHPLGIGKSKTPNCTQKCCNTSASLASVTGIREWHTICLANGQQSSWPTFSWITICGTPHRCAAEELWSALPHKIPRRSTSHYIIAQPAHSRPPPN